MLGHVLHAQIVVFRINDVDSDAFKSCYPGPFPAGSNQPLGIENDIVIELVTDGDVQNNVAITSATHAIGCALLSPQHV